jgi:hypothetical protein
MKQESLRFTFFVAFELGGELGEFAERLFQGSHTARIIRFLRKEWQKPKPLTTKNG